MTRLHWTAVAVFCIAVSFAAGRYTATPEVETVEVVKHSVVTVEKTRVVTEKALQTKTVEKVVYAPGGTVTVERVIEAKLAERTVTDSNTKERDKTESKVAVTPKLPDWRVGALIGSGLPLQPIYGARVDRRIIGPLSVGAWGLSSGVGGLSVSIDL